MLPARYFTELLAGSVAEQRQVFALDANHIPRALELNDASTFRADETIPNLTNFCCVKSARSRLVLARGVEGLTDAAKYFWDIARYIEDGDLSTAEKRLRDAQEKLSDALKRNAPDAEIAKLMARTAPGDEGISDRNGQAHAEPGQFAACRSRRSA